MSGSGLPNLLDQQHLKEARKKKVNQLLDLIDDKTVEWSAGDWDELDDIIDQMQPLLKKKEAPTKPMPPMLPLLKAFARWICSLGAPPPKRTGRKKRKHNEITGGQTNGHFRQNKKSKQEPDTTEPPNYEINTTEPPNYEINTTEPLNTEIDWSSIDLEAIANLSRK